MHPENHPTPENNCNNDDDWQVETDLPLELYSEVEKLIAFGFGDVEQGTVDTSQ